MFFRRTLLPRLLGSGSQGKVSLLFGARQTGKTALLRQVLQRSEPAQLFDLQETSLRRQLESDPARFGREVRALPKGKKVVVVDEMRVDLPIDVKWTERPRPEDARHVELFLDKFGNRAKRGFVVCRCERPQQLTDRVTAIPWSQL